MAQKRGGRFRVCFRYGAKKFRHELKTESEREAQALVGRLEENLILLERGKLDHQPTAIWRYFF